MISLALYGLPLFWGFLSIPKTPFFAFCTPYENEGWMDAFVLVCSGGRSAIIPHQFSGSPVVLPSACFFSSLFCSSTVLRGGLWSFLAVLLNSLSASLRHKGLRQARGFEHGQLSQTSVSPCLVQIQNPKSNPNPNPSPRHRRSLHRRLRPRLVTPLPTSRLLSCQVRHATSGRTSSGICQEGLLYCYNRTPVTARPFFVVALR